MNSLMSQLQKVDLEAQSSRDEKHPQILASSSLRTSQTGCRTKFEYLIPYFICNVSLMLYNKAVLGKVDGSSETPRKALDWKLTENSLIIRGYSRHFTQAPHLSDAVFSSSGEEFR